MQISAINQVLDEDDTVALFEVSKFDSQNEPPKVVMNSEGNPELIDVHQWLSDNGQDIPAYSSFLVGG